jgi:hypothetical protein
MERLDRDTLAEVNPQCQPDVWCNATLTSLGGLAGFGDFEKTLHAVGTDRVYPAGNLKRPSLLWCKHLGDLTLPRVEGHVDA